MIDKMLVNNANRFAIGLAAVFLVSLVGCSTPSHGPRAETRVETTVFVAQDDYYYYPEYGSYYSVSRRQYIYRDGRNWVSRPAPRGVSVEVFMRSPRVFMTFHDSPANHHDTVIKQYPKHWKASGPEQVQKREYRDDRNDRDNRKDRDDRDDRKDKKAKKDRKDSKRSDHKDNRGG
ncbi:MAG: hypothetical protein SFY80_14650 [Verrucomicrobiota bacterium]|nr:hypothetical protein [Verrucomicrobiota bacterium]